MDSVLLTINKLDITALYQSIVSEKTGAVSLFVGTTRDSFEGKKVIFKLFLVFLRFFELFRFKGNPFAPQTFNIFRD